MIKTTAGFGESVTKWKERRLLYAWRELTQAASHQD